MRFTPVVLSLLLCALTRLASAQVPAEFSDLYSELQGQLDQFSGVLESQPAGPGLEVDFSAEFSAGNCHRGPALLTSSDRGNDLLLDAMRALGVRAVTLTISYPFLLREYHASAEERAAYLDFYRRLTAKVRARGLKLIVKSHAMLAPANATLNAFYALPRSFEEYTRGRAEVAETIARELRPDYLTVQVEPDVEARSTGQPVNSPEASASLVQAIVDAVRRAGVADVRLGAGMGTWQPGYDSHIAALGGTDIDFIDLHLYPMQLGFSERVLEMADLAAAAGKGVAMSETWLYKVRQAEVEAYSAGPLEVAGRDAYSFWEPLDRRFLELVVRAARSRGFLFLSPSWSNHLFAYLTYASSREMSPSERLFRAHMLAAFNAVGGLRTGTGDAYSRFMAVP